VKDSSVPRVLFFLLSLHHEANCSVPLSSSGPNGQTALTVWAKINVFFFMIFLSGIWSHPQKG
jgi:hypothetical protein